MPTQELVVVRLGDARLPRATIQRFQRIARVVSLVGNQLGRRLGGRRRVYRIEVRGGTAQRVRHRRGVALVGDMHLGCDHGTGVQIHRMLRLVGQMRATVLQLGDPGIRIGRALPVRIGQLLAFALAIQPHQVLGRWRLDAALLGHAGQHLAIAFAAVAPNNRAECCVGFNR